MAINFYRSLLTLKNKMMALTGVPYPTKIRHGRKPWVLRRR
jgi:hypothetical protein